MAIVSFSDLLKHASEHNYALNIFPAASLTEISAVIHAAHAQRASVVLAPAPDPHDSVAARALLAACEVAAADAQIPVALLGFQVSAIETFVAYVNQGCNSLHITSAQIPFPEAVAQVKMLTDTGKQCGIPTGAVLSSMPAEGAAQGQAAKPAVAECIAFAQRAELDFLEVDSIARVGNGKRRGKIDYDRFKRISDTLGRVLLVRVEGELLPDQVHRLLEYGVALVYHSPTAESRRADSLEEQFKAWGAAGRAAEVLTRCRPWTTVEHVIEFNIQPDALSRVDSVLETGRQRLAVIPGVRRVATGKAIAADARYRFCWIITFANEKIVEFYKHHPIHAEFADGLFRPIAGDRLTTDFKMTGR